MKRSEMKCSGCLFFQPTMHRTFKGLNVAVDGECRLNPPSMHLSRVTDMEVSQVFEDSTTLKAPICYDTFRPLYPLVNGSNWCGKGKWKNNEGKTVIWGRWEEE